MKITHKSEETGGMKVFLNGCKILFLCIIVGGLLITIANYLPIIEEHKNASLSEIGSEGLFPEVPSVQGGYGDFHSENPTALELATDSLMLKMALYQGEGEGITQAFRCYSTQYEDEYSRYWHGYVVVLRILLLFFDYYEIRIINGLCQGVLAALAALYIWRQKGVRYALAAVSSYIFLMPLALAQCLQYSWVYYVSFGAILVYVSHRNFWEKGSRYVYFFILVGVSAIYLDLLTYPLLTWGLPITWWILLQDMEDGVSRVEAAAACVKKVVISALAWVAGYAGMWIGKWALGSVVLGDNLFKRAFSEALLWTVNKGEQSITIQERLKAIYKNWCTYEYKLYFILLAVWLLYWVIKGILYEYKKSRRAPALLLVFCSSIVWYLVLAGHARMHHIFTHRTFGVGIAAFIGMILLSTGNRQNPYGKKRYLFGHMVVLAGISTIAFFLMGQVKDEYLVHNGTYQFMTAEVDEPVSMTFTPSFSEVTELYLGFSVENVTEGSYQVQLLDQDVLLDQLVFPFSENSGGNYHKVGVKWKNLKVGHPYTLLLEPIGNDGNVYLWLTSNGVPPVTEFGEVVLDGGESGQMLFGLNYWCGIRDFSRRSFFMITYVAIGMMIFYVCQSIMYCMGIRRKSTVEPVLRGGLYTPRNEEKEKEVS